MREKLAFLGVFALFSMFPELNGNWAFCQEGPEEFAKKNGSTILERIFPFEQPESVLKPRSYWTCIIRVIKPPDFGVDHLVLRRTVDGATEFQYSFTPFEINWQIFEIKTKDPTATLETVQQRIWYGSYSVRDPDCLEKLKRYADFLKDLRAPILPYDFIAIHSSKCELKCQRGGKWFSFSWASSFEPGEPGSDLNEWVNSLFEIAKKDPQYDAIFGKKVLPGVEKKPVEK